MGSAVDPAALAGAVRYAYERSGVPVLVTEHGMHTRRRLVCAPRFIEPSLAGLLDAIDDGVPVLGYLHWSLMDNFEWIFGYEPQLGLSPVDRTTFERTRKPSADVYERIVRANAVEYLTPSPDRRAVGRARRGDRTAARRAAGVLAAPRIRARARPVGAGAACDSAPAGWSRCSSTVSRVGDELMPGYMQYDRRLPVRTIDVSDHLRTGRTRSSFVLADGWFRGQTGAMRAADQWGTTTSICGGTRRRTAIVVARHRRRSWRSAPSHILQADLIAGQTEDRRRFDPAVSAARFDDCDWRRRGRRRPPSCRSSSTTRRRYGGSRRSCRCRSPSSDPGVHVVDLGQNINGWTRLPDLGPADTELTLDPRRVARPGRRRDDRPPARRLPVPARRRCRPARSTASSPPGAPATCSSRA